MFVACSGFNLRVGLGFESSGLGIILRVRVSIFRLGNQSVWGFNPRVSESDSDFSLRAWLSVAGFGFQSSVRVWVSANFHQPLRCLGMPHVGKLPTIIEGNGWEILKLSSNVLKCNKIVHSARLTCVVVISCIDGF